MEVERYIQLPSPKKLLTPAVVGILVLMVIGYAVAYYAPDFTLNNLVLNPQRVVHGRVWMLVTYPFINLCASGLIWNGIVVLFIGSAIEREWRTKSVVLLWLTVSIICAIIWIIVGLAVRSTTVAAGAGTAACGYGLIGTFGVLFRGKRFFVWLWAMEAQHVAWLFIAVGIVLGIRQPFAWIWVAGALVAYLYVKLRWRISSGATTRAVRPSESTRARGFVDID